MYRGTLGGIIPEKEVKSRNGFSGRVTGGGSAGSSPRTSFVLKSDASRDLVAAVEALQRNKIKVSTLQSLRMHVL
jgi:hypothetical protein